MPGLRRSIRFCLFLSALIIFALFMSGVSVSGIHSVQVSPSPSGVCLSSMVVPPPTSYWTPMTSGWTKNGIITDGGLDKWGRPALYFQNGYISNSGILAPPGRRSRTVVVYAYTMCSESQEVFSYFDFGNCSQDVQIGAYCTKYGSKYIQVDVYFSKSGQISRITSYKYNFSSYDECMGWHMIAVVYNDPAGVLKFYMDGQLFATASVTDYDCQVTCKSQPCGSLVGNYYYRGYISGVYYWDNVVLDDAQIMKMYQDGPVW